MNKETNNLENNKASSENISQQDSNNINSQHPKDVGLTYDSDNAQRSQSPKSFGVALPNVTPTPEGSWHLLDSLSGSIGSVALQSKATSAKTQKVLAPIEPMLSQNPKGLGSNTKKIGDKQRTSWPLEISQKPNRQDIVSITYEEIGFFPRSFSRVFDRFLKQVFSDVENLVIQEYRFYRYLFLTTLKCVLILFFVPFIANHLSKTYLVSPLTEYFWNTQQTEIFLNSYQQKRAFTELKDFEEKLYFESLINSGSKPTRLDEISTKSTACQKPPSFGKTSYAYNKTLLCQPPSVVDNSPLLCSGLNHTISGDNYVTPKPEGLWQYIISTVKEKINNQSTLGLSTSCFAKQSNVISSLSTRNIELEKEDNLLPAPLKKKIMDSPEIKKSLQVELEAQNINSPSFLTLKEKESNLVTTPRHYSLEVMPTPFGSWQQNSQKLIRDSEVASNKNNIANINTNLILQDTEQTISKTLLEKPDKTSKPEGLWRNIQKVDIVQKSNRQEIFEQRLQEKTIELAIRYNNQSIEAITNFFADLISFITLCYLLIILEIQINITKSFLLEVFFGLDDGKKSLLILLITDLLVGYHSSNLWELFFEFLFNHYGLPESQTGIFLLVATLPVLLDVLFKYLIFRHLNRSSPATVATYHAIIE